MALTKDQKIEKLKSAGVELSGDERVKDLDALLEVHGEMVPSEASVDEIEAAPGVQNSVQKKNESCSSVSVRYINPELGLTDRVFSVAIHGENFMDLAKGFAEKFNGQMDPEVS